MTTDRQLFTTQDAVRFIKKALAGTRFYLHVDNDIPIEGEEDRVFPSASIGSVKLTRPDAIKLVSNYVSPGLEARGGRVPISVYRDGVGEREYVAYWIG